MPQFTSNHFGVVEYEEEAVIHFPGGLPGFEEETRFLAIEPEHSRPVVFLQSLGRATLAFVTLPVAAIDPAYSLALSPEQNRVLGLEEGAQARQEDLLCLAIVCLREDGTATANLLGPVVVHRYTRRAVQAVRDDARYSAEHPLRIEEGPCS